MDHKVVLKEMWDKYPETFAIIAASACPDDFEIKTNECDDVCTHCWKQALNECN